MRGSPKSDTSTGALCARLRIVNPWPATCPSVPCDPDEACFNNARPLAALLTSEMLVLELGSWLGASTRFFARHAGSVIAVDHWRGSSEHQLGGTAASAKLATLYETFLANCWDDRARILPLRMTTAEGIARIHAAGIHPDLVYVDADHSYEGCLADLRACDVFGEQTLLTGDDWGYAPSAGVTEAVRDYARERCRTIQTDGLFWRLV